MFPRCLLKISPDPYEKSLIKLLRHSSTRLDYILLCYNAFQAKEHRATYQRCMQHCLHMQNRLKYRSLCWWHHHQVEENQRPLMTLITGNPSNSLIYDLSYWVMWGGRGQLDKVLLGWFCLSSSNDPLRRHHGHDHHRCPLIYPTRTSPSPGWLLAMTASVTATSTATAQLCHHNISNLVMMMLQPSL